MSNVEIFKESLRDNVRPFINKIIDEIKKSVEQATPRNYSNSIEIS